MTRINAFIPVEELSDKHLIAEHREIKRIPNMVGSGKAKLENIPEQFTLGKGHVKFFYNKLKYLYLRYAELYYECKKRGFNVTNYKGAWDFLFDPDNENYDTLFKGWHPKPDEVNRVQSLIRNRIKENQEKSKAKSSVK